MKQALVLLSDKDTDSPALPAVCTVSKYDNWAGADGGAWAIGAASGVVWIDRPYFTGNPSADWLADKVRRNFAAGGHTQIGNEQNHPIEAFVGTPADLFALHAATLALLSPDEQASVIAQPPSPGFPGWESWVNPSAPKHAVHCYGSLDQMRQIVLWFLDSTNADLYITECNPGAGNTFDLNLWAVTDLDPFLDWCATEPRVKVAAYFAWRWNESANLPSSVDAAGTAVEQVLKTWQAPATASPASPVNRPAAIVDQRGKLPTLQGRWTQLAYHDRPLSGIVGATFHYTGAPASQTPERIAAYQISAAAAPQTGAGQPFPAIAYTLLVDGDGIVNICHDLTARTWHSSAVVNGIARNASHIGIVYTGDKRPNAKQIAGLAVAVDWCESELARRLNIEGHGDSMSTACPGPDWPKWKPEVERELAVLRGGSMPPPVDPKLEANVLAPLFKAQDWLAKNAKTERERWYQKQIEFAYRDMKGEVV